MNSQNTAALRLDSRDSPARRLAEKAPRDLLRQDHGGILDKVLLIGQPPLQKYLRFVRDKVVNGAEFDRRVLAGEWRRANEYYQELEESETGIADDIEVLDLDPALAPLVADMTASSRYRYTFKTFATSFAMVELDRLVLYQTHVIQQGIDRLKACLGPEPDPAALFRFCQSPDVPEAPVKIRRVGSTRYVFTCESTDFRRHDPALLRPDQIRDHETPNPISGVVALAVGFGSNFLTAIRQGEDGRVLLHNGYHRAYALRALGITHAPCIIQTVTTPDELGIAVTAKVAKDPDFYFASARPPLLKDFFDPKIRTVHRIYKTLKMIEIEFEVREHYVGA